MCIPCRVKWWCWLLNNMLIKGIEQLRRKSPAVRNRWAFGIATVFTFFIFTLWVVQIPNQYGSFENPAPTLKDDVSLKNFLDQTRTDIERLTEKSAVRASAVAAGGETGVVPTPVSPPSTTSATPTPNQVLIETYTASTTE